MFGFILGRIKPKSNYALDTFSLRTLDVSATTTKAMEQNGFDIVDGWLSKVAATSLGLQVFSAVHVSLNILPDVAHLTPNVGILTGLTFWRHGLGCCFYATEEGPRYQFMTRPPER